MGIFFSESCLSLLFLLLLAFSVWQCRSSSTHRLSHCFQQNYFHSEESFAAVNSEYHLPGNLVITERVYKIKSSTTKYHKGKKKKKDQLCLCNLYLFLFNCSSTHFYLYVTKQLIIKTHSGTYNTNNFCLLLFVLYAHEL